MKTPFEEEDDYYKAINAGNVWNNNYIMYESNGDKNKNLSAPEYLNEIKPYLKDVITEFQDFGKGKVQLTIAVSFISSIDNDK